MRQGSIFTGNQKFQGNIYLKPEKSPEGRWFRIVNYMMSPYDLYEILSGFLFLVILQRERVQTGFVLTFYMLSLDLERFVPYEVWRFQ